MQPNVLIRNQIGTFLLLIVTIFEDVYLIVEYYLTYLGITSRHPVAGNVDARVQNMDPRTRMLLQRPQVAASIPQQHFQGNQTMQTRMPTVRNSITEPYDVLQQQRFPGMHSYLVLQIFKLNGIVEHSIIESDDYRYQSRSEYGSTHCTSTSG